MRTVFALLLLAVCTAAAANVRVESVAEDAIFADAFPSATALLSVSFSPDGTPNFDSDEYEVVCNCDENRIDEDDICIKGMSRLDIKLLRRGEGGIGHSAPIIREIIEKATNTRWIKAENASFASADGRTRDAVLAAPGGDFGLFLQALAGYELASGSPLDYKQVKSLLFSWLMAVPSRHFYYGTDQRALDHLSAGLDMGDFDLLDKPESATKESLMKGLTQFDNIGDPTLKKIARFPHKWRVQPELLEHLTHAFFNILWKRDLDDSNDPGQQLKIVVHEGMHQEKAIVGILAGDACVKEGLEPIIAPKHCSESGICRSFLPIHYDAVNRRREQLADFVSANLPDVPRAKLVKKMDMVNNVWERLFTAQVNKGFPVYLAQFSNKA